MADTSQPHSSRCPAWLREGGLYLIVSGVVTVLKYLLLLFLPRAFAFLPMRDFGWPGIEMTLLGEPSAGTSSATTRRTAGFLTCART